SYPHYDSLSLHDALPIYEGRRRFGLWSGSGLIFVLVFGGLQVLGLGIAEKENETSAVRRPFEVVNTLGGVGEVSGFAAKTVEKRSEEHTSELQSRVDLVC